MKFSASVACLVLAFFSSAYGLCTYPGGGAEEFCIYANDQGNSVKFRYDAPASFGWVAFGPGQGMNSGDIVVAWLNSDNTVTVSRRRVSGFGLPTHVANQVTLIPAESGLFTINGKQRMIATFTRDKAQLSGLDAIHAISGSSQSLIWAVNPTTKPAGKDPASTFSKHANAGAGMGLILDPSNAYNPPSPSPSPSPSPKVSPSPSPKVSPSPSPKVSPSPSPKVSPSPSPSGVCVAKLLQCGGQYYTGVKNCCSGTTCTFKTNFYSQCV